MIFMRCQFDGEERDGDGGQRNSDIVKVRGEGLQPRSNKNDQAGDGDEVQQLQLHILVKNCGNTFRYRTLLPRVTSPKLK